MPLELGFGSAVSKLVTFYLNNALHQLIGKCLAEVSLSTWNKSWNPDKVFTSSFSGKTPTAGYVKME